MKKKIGNLFLFTLFLIALITQICFIKMDSKQSPSIVAIKFAKEYYFNSTNMEEFISKKLGEKHLIEKYINNISNETLETGFDNNYMRKLLFDIRTETTYHSKKTAEVKLNAYAKRYINPVYSLVANVFKIGKKSIISENFVLEKENGKWKIVDFDFRS